MSAWIVGSDHLDLLLTAAMAWHLLDPDRADETGRMLWRENLNSLAHRYPGDRDGQRPGPIGLRDRHVDTYRLRPYPGRVDPQVVEPAAASLAYQSCEHPGWTASEACAFTTRLKAEAQARTDAYIAEHGPVDLRLQPTGDRGWYVMTDMQGQRHIRCGDGWNVPDRDVLRRAAALRTPPEPPATPSQSASRTD
jgi:hypothetical protein